MSGFVAGRPAALSLEAAQAFLDASARLEALAALPRADRPRAPALAAARRLLSQRQAIAQQLKPSSNGDAGVFFEFDANGWMVAVDILSTGAVDLVATENGGPGEFNQSFPSVSCKPFRQALARLVDPPRSKYNAKKADCRQGHTHDSQIEARRCDDLAGDPLVSDILQQVPYAFDENGKAVFRWIADFVYRRDGRLVVEDVKGARPKDYALKKKLIEARHGFEIEEWPVSKETLRKRAAAELRARKAAEKAARAAERERKRSVKRND